MESKLAFVKERILYVAKIKGIRLADFCESIGQTYGNYKGENIKSAVSSEVLVRLLAIYPDVNADFILRGTGAPITPERSIAENAEERAALADIEREDTSGDPHPSEVIQLLKSEVAYLRGLVLKRDEQLFELVKRLNTPPQ